MHSTNVIIRVIFTLMSIANASMLIFEFYDTVDPVHRQVERYCLSTNHTERNLCKLLRQYDGPCKNETNKKSCIYKQCKEVEMSTMPICKKLRPISRALIQEPKTISRRSLPLILRIFNVNQKRNNDTQLSPKKNTLPK